MADTKIEWATKVWNPVTGCSPISAGCANCYAKRMANRLRGRCGYPADEPFRVTLHPEKLDEPLRWKSTRIFVCSMGDLFHEDVPFYVRDGLIITAKKFASLDKHGRDVLNLPGLWDETDVDMAFVGKKYAGALLDGKQYYEFPEVSNVYHF